MVFIVIIAYFGCHGTNDQRGEYLNLLGKNIRTSRLAKISTIIQKDPELRDNLKDARIIVYVNACRGREYEELADLEFDSSIGNIQTAETDNISKQLSKEWGQTVSQS